MTVAGRTFAAAQQVARFAQEQPGAIIALVSSSQRFNRDHMIRAIRHIDPSAQWRGQVLTWPNGSRAVSYSQEHQLHGNRHDFGWLHLRWNHFLPTWWEVTTNRDLETVMLTTLPGGEWTLT